MVATAHLSEIEECMYSRLVDSYYAREAPIPLDVQAACRLVRAISPSARRAVQTVLQEFFTEDDDGWHQKRCDEEITKYREKAAKASRSASVRWCERNASAMRTHSEGNANQNQEPEPIKTKPARDARVLENPPPEGVDADNWTAWVRKKGKKQTLDADRLQRKRLAEWRADGHDVNRIVEDAVAGGWEGLHLPNNRAPPRQSIAERRASSIDRIIAIAEHGQPRVIDVSAERLDREIVPAVPADLRKSG